MQQISCDTALVRTMGYNYWLSIVPFALMACGPRAYVTTEPTYAMWTRACVTTITCTHYNYIKEGENVIFMNGSGLRDYDPATAI